MKPTNKTTPLMGAILAAVSAYASDKLGLSAMEATAAVFVLSGIILAVLPDSVEARIADSFKKLAGLWPALLVMVYLGGCSALAPSITFDGGRVTEVNLGTYTLLDGLPSDQKHVQASTTGLNVRQLSLGITSVDRTDNSTVAAGDEVSPLRRTQETNDTGIDYDLTMGDAFDSEAK